MAKRGLGKGLGAFFGEDVANGGAQNTEKTSRKKTENSEIKEEKKFEKASIEDGAKNQEIKKIVVEKIVEKPVEQKLKLTLIEPNSNQPRKNFDEEALNELADSIKAYGILQPLLVQKKGNHYEIIAGVRRWRAAMLEVV